MVGRWLIRLRREFFKFVPARWRRRQGGVEAVALVFGVGLSGGGCRGGGHLTELDSTYSTFCDSLYSRMYSSIGLNIRPLIFVM